jgi:hypothetical protein
LVQLQTRGEVTLFVDNSHRCFAWELFIRTNKRAYKEKKNASVSDPVSAPVSVFVRCLPCLLLSLYLCFCLCLWRLWLRSERCTSGLSSTVFTVLMRSIASWQWGGCQCIELFRRCSKLKRTVPSRQQSLFSEHLGVCLHQ